MKLVKCERCGRTEQSVEGAANKDWTRYPINYFARDLCPSCTDVLKEVHAQFLANGALPLPAKPR